MLTVQQRLSTLERRCRKLQALLFIAMVCTATPWVMGARENVQEVVRARNFLLYDSDGNQRGAWMCHADGKAHFFVTSPDNKTSLVLVADNDSATFEADFKNEGQWIAGASAKGGRWAVRRDPAGNLEVRD